MSTPSILHGRAHVGHHDWMAEEAGEMLAHNRFLTGGIWRVDGPGNSMIRKRLNRPAPPAASAQIPVWDAHWTAGAESKRHWNYWRREALAYQEGLVNSYATAGIAGPRCYRIDESGDGIELW